MKKFITVLCLGLVLSGCQTKNENNVSNSIPNNKSMTFDQTALPQAGEKIAVMETTEGTIKMRLFADKTPKTVENFIGLAEKGYYNGIIFHRVIKDFMIQGGDPTGTGMGGESLFGGSFEDEFVPELKNVRGALSMANAGPNTNGSQFFIVHSMAGAPWLDGLHTVFGQVYEGMEVVDKIASVETNPREKPLQDIVIQSIIISNQ